MVSILAGGHVSELYAHWPIALAMSLGSYFAGSTPMGGGTVGFPVLVMLQGEPSGMGRDFGFAIQSIGMFSASIFIWSQGYSGSRKPSSMGPPGLHAGNPHGIGASWQPHALFMGSGNLFTSLGWLWHPSSSQNLSHEPSFV